MAASTHGGHLFHRWHINVGSLEPALLRNVPS
jgi:hypothetical protein